VAMASVEAAMVTALAGRVPTEKRTRGNASEPKNSGDTHWSGWVGITYDRRIQTLAW
jgi:hypothetical protein